MLSNLSKAHFYILNFGRPTEMSTEGNRVRYIEFIILLSILEGNVDMNSYWLEKSEMRILALHV